MSNSLKHTSPNTLGDPHAGAEELRVYKDGTVELPQYVRRLYNATGAAIPAGAVLVEHVDGDEETNPTAITAAAIATVLRPVVVAIAAVSTASWGWFAYKGYVDALVDGDSTDVDVDDLIKVVPGTNADAFVQEATAGTITASTVGIACEANTGAEALARVYLFGRNAVVNT